MCFGWNGYVLFKKLRRSDEPPVAKDKEPCVSMPVGAVRELDKTKIKLGFLLLQPIFFDCWTLFVSTNLSKFWFGSRKFK